MTTIIVVAIVALVFFVSVCTIAFMIWKRETEMRTDSLRGIETGLNEVIYELSGNSNNAESNNQRTRAYETDFEYVNRPNIYQRKSSLTRKNSYNKTNNRDPFSWVRTTGRDYRGNGTEGYIGQAEEHPNPKVFRPTRDDSHRVSWTEVTSDDIVDAPASRPRRMKTASPSFAKRNETRSEERFDEISLDFDDFMSGEDEIYSYPRDKMDENSLEYDTGRSGRKYTAEELESLIKE